MEKNINITEKGGKKIMDLNVEGKKNNTDSNNICCKDKIKNYNINNRIFEDDVTIENIKESEKYDKLVFESCIFNNLKLSKISLENITFINCTVFGEVIVFGSNIEEINIRECENINKLIIEEVNLNKNDFKIAITKSKIDKVKISSTDIKELDFRDIDSSCQLIRFVKGGKADVIKLKCFVNKIIIRELPKILLKEGGKVECIELEGINKTLLNIYEKDVIKNNQGTYIGDNLNRYKSVILAMYQSFENRKMFAESDICLFEIRRLGILINKSNQPFYIKILLILQQFFLEKCFGWGIRIYNNILTMLIVIVIFAGLYFGESCKKETLELNVIKCFEISTNRFFLIGIDEFNYSFLGYFESLESIIGVILLTIITGVLVRKIIR